MVARLKSALAQQTRSVRSDLLAANGVVQLAEGAVDAFLDITACFRRHM